MRKAVARKCAELWAAAGLLLTLSAGAVTACTVFDEGRRLVISVPSADVLQLETGHEVKLLGALPPPNGVVGETLTALSTMTLGKAVAIATFGQRIDRHGRLMGQAFIIGEVPTTGAAAPSYWLQGRLVAAGLARAYAYPGHAVCVEELVRAENEARIGRLGHWGTGVFADRDAANVRELDAQAGTFQTVTGKVASVSAGSDGASGDALLRFEHVEPSGRGGDPTRKTRQFNVAVPGRPGEFSSQTADSGSSRKRQRGRRSTSTQDWSQLAGAEVRVRGWIERRPDGPRIALTDARELEVLVPAAASNRAAQRPNTGTPDLAPAPAAPPLIETSR